VEVLNSFEQWPGQRREPRPDFDHQVGRLRLDRGDDPSDVAAVDEEVLAETTPRPVLAHLSVAKCALVHPQRLGWA
jgi:hypothetical protein